MPLVEVQYSSTHLATSSDSVPPTITAPAIALPHPALLKLETSVSLLFPSIQPNISTYLYILFLVPYLCHSFEFLEDSSVSRDIVDEVDLRVPEAIATKVTQVTAQNRKRR